MTFFGSNGRMNFLQKATSLVPAEVRMISGCDDEQTSADVSNVTSTFQLPSPAGKSGGACTSAVLDILYAESRNGYQRNRSFQDILMQLRGSLASDGYSQVPQLTSSRPLDVKETPFHIVGGNGTRRAVLVGINYKGQDGQLSGCHNDVKNMKTYLKEVHGFPTKNITILMDDGWNTKPTRGNIIKALEKVVKKSVAGDSVFFHYSGHGGVLLPDQNYFKKNSTKQFDETLIPVDYKRQGHIRDFNLFKNFVQPMAAGVTVTCLMDCCHSGSVLDLPYSFKADGTMDRMVESFDTLSNIAYLFTLTGGLLPHGFEDVAEYIGDVIGEDTNQLMDGAAEAFGGIVSNSVENADAIRDAVSFEAGDRGGITGGEDFVFVNDEGGEDDDGCGFDTCVFLGGLVELLRHIFQEDGDEYQQGGEY